MYQCTLCRDFIELDRFKSSHNCNVTLQHTPTRPGISAILPILFLASFRSPIVQRKVASFCRYSNCEIERSENPSDLNHYTLQHQGLRSRGALFSFFHNFVFRRSKSGPTCYSADHVLHPLPGQTLCFSNLIWGHFFSGFFTSINCCIILFT